MSDINIRINVLSQAAQASVSGIAKEASRAEKNFKGLNVSIKNSAGFLTSFAGNLAAIGASKIIGAISTGFSTLSGSVADATIELETAATKFEVLTGSAARANQIMQELQEFSANTPFQFTEVASAAQRLLSFGFTTEEVKDRLQDLGDVAAASGADVNELSLIFGQVRAAGKLTGERLLQLQERAIPIGPALAESLGVAESQIRKLVSEGKVSFDEFEEAFRSLNEEGEFAFGGIEKRSQTLAGRISTLKDNFALFSADIGERFTPVFKVAITSLTEFLQTLQNSVAFQAFLDNVAQNIPRAIQFAGQAIQFFTDILFGVQKFFNFVSFAAAELTQGFVNFGIKTLETVAAVKSFLGLDTSGLDETIGNLKNLGSEMEQVSQLTQEANLEVENSQNKLNAAIQSGVDFVVTKYKEEAQAAQDKKDAVVNANEEEARAAQIAAQQKAEALRREQEERLRILTEQQVLEDELALQKQESIFLQDDILLEQEKFKLQQMEDLRATARENEQLALQQQLLTEQEFAKASLKVQVDQAKRANALAKAQAALEAKERDRKLTETANLFGGLAQLSATGGARLFKITQGLQLAEATVAGFNAVQKAASALPYPANIPGIITETARAAATVIGIRNTTPKFQEGGIVPGGSFSGDNVFARVNSGEMILNRQQQSQLFDIANGRQGGGRVNEITTIVQIGEEEVARAVSRQVAQGFQLGEGGV